jgi:hypothetical protein
VQLGEELSESLRGLQVCASYMLSSVLGATVTVVVAVADSPKVICSEIGFSACNTAR